MLAVPIILAVYAATMLLFLWGWLRLPVFRRPRGCRPQPVSVVVAFRNEAENLPALLQALHRQQHVPQGTEWLFVDDHSTDGGAACIAQGAPLPGRTRVLRLKNGSGKKAALHLGITQATHGTILATDADTLPHPAWLCTQACALALHRADVLLGPVALCGPSPWQQWQQLEFSALQAATAGAAGLGSPVMANGANIAFTKALYQQAQSALHPTLPSGDDMFLLHYAKRANKRIRYTKSPQARVETTAAANPGGFWQQRLRWAGKTRHYTDAPTLATAMVVFAGNAAMLAAFVLSAAHPVLWVYIILLKFLPDLLLLAAWHRFFSTGRLLMHFPALALAYPFYAVGAALASQLVGFRWKGRHSG